MPRSPGNPKDQKITGRRLIHLLPAILQSLGHSGRYTGLVVGIGIVAGIARELEVEHFRIHESHKAPAVQTSLAFATVIGKRQANKIACPRWDRGHKNRPGDETGV